MPDILTATTTATAAGVDWFKYLSPLASVIVSAGITLLCFRKKRHDDYLSYLDKQLDDILKLSVTCPHFEHAAFCDTWTRDRAQGDTPEALRYLQYSIYATLVFNYVSRLCGHFRYNEQKILAHTDIKDWLRIHKKVWKQPLNHDNENIDSYDRKMVDIVNRILG